jgi:(E)-4-hydroxy-3-methylbut-2-enyl-diphosphate synthase
LFKTLITVAVMGCEVNGPGEASRADYGFALSGETGVIFKKGDIISKQGTNNLVQALINTIKDDLTLRGMTT